MDININNSGNGTCPDCSKRPKCEIHASIIDALKTTSDPYQSGIEMVIYDCPNFSKN